MVKTWKITVAENGKAGCELVSDLNGKSDLNFVSQILPAGAYTTFRTFGSGKVLHMDEHFSRLEETARLSQTSVKIDRDYLRSALRETVGVMPSNSDYRVRLTLDLFVHPGEIYISVENLSAPSEKMYQEGVRVVTRNFQRTNPKAKLTSFIHKAEEMRKEIPQGVNEVVMVDDNGCILEGISSNFFAVKNGTIYTAEEGVLHGLTRSIVLEEIQRMGIPLKLEGVCLDEIDRIDEVFITSASRAVLPVRMIDSTVIGKGVPGDITKALYARYTDRLAREVEIF